MARRSKRKPKGAKCPKCGQPISIGLDGLQHHGLDKEDDSPNIRTTRFDRVNRSRISVTSAGLPTLGKR